MTNRNSTAYKRKTGRPNKYNEALAKRICDQVADTLGHERYMPATRYAEGGNGIEMELE